MPSATACFYLFLAGLALAGCASSPETHFYTLSPAAPADKAIAAQARYKVAVGPVKVPEMVDRPQFVVRQGDNRVELLEQHRWAQPIRTEIARALAADLRQQLPQAQVSFYNDYAAQNPDCRVLMDIERFDAARGKAVTVQGAWSVVCTKPDAKKTGRATVREAVRSDGFDQLAAAYGRALSAMSVEIADAVSSLQTAGGKPLNAP
jgi:uncharacterized lipoprotein YmbA